jgi:hypothetical protein
MKYIRFKSDSDRLHWQRVLSREGGATAFKGRIYLISDEQYAMLQSSNVELELSNREAVERELGRLRRESA